MTDMNGDVPIDEGSQLEALAAEDPNNAGNPAAVRKKAKDRKDAEKRRVLAMENLLATPDGRELLRYLLNEVCGLFNISENAAFMTEALHYKEGGRVVGLALHKLALQANPKRYIDLLTESQG